MVKTKQSDKPRNKKSFANPHGLSYQYGSTLIETLVYIAVFAFIISSMIGFGLNVIQAGIKSAAQQEVYSAARFISEKIKYEIRNSDGINTSTSDFGVNLAATPGAQLSLVATSAPADPIIFDVSGNYARVKRGAATAVNLNSVLTKVTSLTFTNYSSANTKTQNVGFVLTVTDAYTGVKQEYNATITLESSAEFRGNSL